MQITLGQRLTLTILEYVLNFLWFFDYWAVYQKKAKVYLGASFCFMVLAICVGIANSSSVHKQTNYLSSGVLASLYPDSGQVNFNNVLGVSKKRDIPYLLKEVAPPQISSKAAIAVDVTSNKVLFEYNSATQFAPASTTKLMTALVALDVYKLDDVLTVPYFCTLTESQRLGFTAGTSLKVKDLIYSLLISSAGDSACTLASANMPYTKYVELMNSKAKEIGLDSTQFTNPIGLDGAHYSTAHDLYKLARYAIQHETISTPVSMSEYSFTDTEGKQAFKAYTTNRLLHEIPGTIGVKTGKTQEAGEVLIYEYKKENKNIMIVVMGSLDRFADTKNILTWVLKNYFWDPV
jgi:serine-type D-Ala-D-Ala carboxypeptidase (penicillin-binding protein 5/6)